MPCSRESLRLVLLTIPSVVENHGQRADAEQEAKSCRVRIEEYSVDDIERLLKYLYSGNSESDEHYGICATIDADFHFL